VFNPSIEVLLPLNAPTISVVMLVGPHYNNTHKKWIPPSHFGVEGKDKIKDTPPPVFPPKREGFSQMFPPHETPPL